MHPYRRYNKLGPVTFWPFELQVSEKRCCSCSKVVQHAELTLCVRQPLKKWRLQLLAYLIKSGLLFFIIGSYINVFNWNGHVAMYFRQFCADRVVNGPKIYPKYGDVWWFWPNWSTYSCTLLPIHITTVLYLIFSSFRMWHWWKNQFEHGEVGITWSINPLFATTHTLRFWNLVFANKYGMQSNNCGMWVYMFQGILISNI